MHRAAMLNALPELGAVLEGFLKEGPTSDLHSVLSCGAPLATPTTALEHCSHG